MVWTTPVSDGMNFVEAAAEHGPFFSRAISPAESSRYSFLHRWMGSIAMDKTGNMALGFSAASGTLFPSVRYVGRLVTDPPGVMPQGEAPDGDFTMVSGAGAQFATRWGDYSSMNIDPVDGCTLLVHQEYIDATAVWRTRIGAFSFPSCQKIIGDLNRDGTVDAKDYEVFRATLGKIEGDLGYNSDADYDGDKRITYSDYTLWYQLYKSYVAR